MYFYLDTHSLDFFHRFYSADMVLGVSPAAGLEGGQFDRKRN